MKLSGPRGRATCSQSHGGEHISDLDESTLCGFYQAPARSSLIFLILAKPVTDSLDEE